MALKIRIMAATTDELDAIQDALAAAGLNMASGDRDYPNRSGFGFRRYIEVRVPDIIRTRAARDDRREIEPGS